MLKGVDSKEQLDAEDVDKCNKMVEKFVASTDPSENLILSDRLLINQCFYHFKHLLKDQMKKAKQGGGNSAPQAIEEAKGSGDSQANAALQEEVQRL